MDALASYCTICGYEIRIPASAAWPERCGYCCATPLAVRGGAQQLSPVGSIDPVKAANAALRAGIGTRSFQTIS